MFVLPMPAPNSNSRTRSVRLDGEAERALAEIQRRTGDSISAALKRGLLTAQRELRASLPRTAWEIYQSLDLGPGGNALGPSTKVRQTVREYLRKKHGR